MTHWYSLADFGKVQVCRNIMHSIGLIVLKYHIINYLMIQIWDERTWRRRGNTMHLRGLWTIDNSSVIQADFRKMSTIPL